MKINLKIFPLYILFLIACEDKIDIDLAQSDTFVAVDAWIDTRDQVQEIRLQKSQQYFDSSPLEGIDDAEVRVSGPAGTFEFTSIGDGRYQYNPNGNVIGTVGDELSLEIVYNGALLSSVAVINDVPDIDSIGIEIKDGEFGYVDGPLLQFYARDLDGINNVYWIKSYKNGNFLNKPEEINLAFDASFDGGGDVDGIIFIRPIRELINPINDDEEVKAEVPLWASGDEATVEIHSLTLESFNFLELMRDELLKGDSGIFASPIANTTSNIRSSNADEKVLGFFNVAKVSSKSRTIN